MPILINGLRAEMSGQVTIEEAEQLYQWLLAQPQATVVLKQIDHLHTAIWQLLLLFHPSIAVQGEMNAVIEHWLLPELLPKEHVDENHSDY